MKKVRNTGNFPTKSLRPSYVGMTNTQYFTKARNRRSLTPKLRWRAQSTRSFRDLLMTPLQKAVL